jgi:DNA-binding transcriptional ArsR family regulator
VVRLLRALGDETRFRIVQEIAAAGEVTCGALVATSGLAQPTVSHHLKVLVDAGVLELRVEGKHHFLSVKHALLGQLREVLRQRLSPGGARRALP